MNKWYKLIEKFDNVRYLYNILQFCKNSLIKDVEPNNKIFVIGLNKTGTTSTEQALIELGYKMGNQADAELLGEYVLFGNYQFLIKYLKTAEAFQDIPFSIRGFYKILHQKYPQAKFILTVRRDADTWCQSLINFTKKNLKSQNIEFGDKVTINDTKKIVYRYPMMYARLSKMLWTGDRHFINDDEPLYNEEYLKYYYNQHIEESKEYFRNNENFLILNVESQGAYKELCTFLGKEPLKDEFPHLNKTN